MRRSKSKNLDTSSGLLRKTSWPIKMKESNATAWPNKLKNVYTLKNYQQKKVCSKSFWNVIKPFFTKRGIITNDSMTLEENSVHKNDPKETTEVFNNYWSQWLQP